MSLTPLARSRYVPWVINFPPENPHPPEKPGPAAVVGLILHALWAAIAAALVRRLDLVPKLRLLWSRLQKTSRRLDRLAELVAQGRLPPPRARAANPRTPTPPDPDREQPLRLPQGFGWLIPLVPMVGNFGTQLEHLLDDPEMRALIEAAPQAKRLLRPLLHMLGRRAPAFLALPARPRKPRPPKPRTPRERRWTHTDLFGRPGNPGYIPPVPRRYRHLYKRD